MSALAEKLEAAGFRREEMEFYAHCIAFLKAGGNATRGHDILTRAANELSAKGQTPRVESQSTIADRAQPVAGTDGQRNNAKAVGMLPSVSARKDGAVGHSHSDKRSMGSLPAAPSSARLRATENVRRALAITVLDTYKIDGKPIGDFTVAEALERGKDKTREATILLRLARIANNMPSGAKLREIVKVEEAQAAIQAAAEVADAA